MFIPIWVLGLALVSATVIMLLVHRRLSIAERLSLLIPSLCVFGLYVALSLSDLSHEIQLMGTRVSFIAWVFWQSSLLIITRKRHL